MNWCIKKKGYRHDVYDESGVKTAAIYAAGRKVRVVSDKTEVWTMEKSANECWKITGSDCEYLAAIQPDQESQRLLFPLKKLLTLEIAKEQYCIEQWAWLDAKVYCGQREIATVRRDGFSDILFSMQQEAERDFAYLIAALTVLMQYEEQPVLNACCR